MRRAPRPAATPAPVDRRATIVPMLFVVVTNAAVMLPVVLWGAPAGNPLLLWLIEAILLGVATVLVVHRAERQRRKPTIASRDLLGFLLSTGLIGCFFVFGFAYGSGLSFSTRAFWIPLLLIVVRAGVEALGLGSRGLGSRGLGSRGGLASSDGAELFGNLALRMLTLGAGVFLAMWLFRDLAPQLRPTEHPRVILAIFVVVKMAVEMFLARKLTGFRR